MRGPNPGSAAALRMCHRIAQGTACRGQPHCSTWQAASCLPWPESTLAILTMTNHGGVGDFHVLGRHGFAETCWYINLCCAVVGW